ncbi:hypothetical protein KUTeg_009453 [Tegillarca granosa]|uniref:RRM domain-containing protein n=1 Tax=Tegillarca granosa TaxID=220873 RepID=A0ABQ9F3W6_TEGGR|nr:hypothetical protein KUTeg_009453 [Tegillarca granosa]
MDYDRRYDHSSVNGLSKNMMDDKKRRNYKLVADPMLRGGGQKIYRFEGIDPAENRPISVRDPRSRLTRLWTRRQPADLPVPKFKYDHYYVGSPPPNEITFTNLNDNINKDFLENMVKVFGQLEEVKIYYNPKNKKHLGIGKVQFASSKQAKACAEKLNNTSKMGNIMSVFIDAGGKERQKILEDVLAEKPKTTAAAIPSAPPTPTRTSDPRRRSSVGFPNAPSSSSLQSDMSTSAQSESSFEAYDPEAYEPPEYEFHMGQQQNFGSLGPNNMGPGNMGTSYPQSERSFAAASDRGYASATPVSDYSTGSGKPVFDIMNTGMTPGMTPAMTPNVSGNFYNAHNQYGIGQNQDYNSGYGFQQPSYNNLPNTPLMPVDTQQPPPPHPPPQQQQHNYQNEPDNSNYSSDPRDRNRHWKRDQDSDRFDGRKDSDRYDGRKDYWERGQDRYRDRNNERDRGIDRSDRYSNKDRNRFSDRDRYNDRDKERNKEKERSKSINNEKESKPITPKTPERQTSQEDDHRPLSLDSRIQSLLQGTGMADTFGSPPSDSASESKKKEQTPPHNKWEKTPVPKTPEMTQPSPVPFVGMDGMYNPNFYDQYGNSILNNNLNNQSVCDNLSTSILDEASEKKFMSVLENFVKELKQVMQKDLCKKMVENSAFKSFDSWWTSEELKNKKKFRPPSPQQSYDDQSKDNTEMAVKEEEEEEGESDKEDSEEKSLRPVRKRAILSDSESEDEASEREGRESGESEESESSSGDEEEDDDEDDSDDEDSDEEESSSEESSSEESSSEEEEEKSKDDQAEKTGV